MTRAGKPTARERKPREDREHKEAVALMKLVDMHSGRWPELVRIFHVPNGGARSKATAGKLKAEGVRAGVPDYLMPLRRGQHVGLAIELKASGGRVEPEQRDWLTHLQSQGWVAVTAYGAVEAWEFLRKYVEGAK